MLELLLWKWSKLTFPFLLPPFPCVPSFPDSSISKELACNTGELGLIPGKIPWRKVKATHSSILAILSFSFYSLLNSILLQISELTIFLKLFWQRSTWDQLLTEQIQWPLFSLDPAWSLDSIWWLPFIPGNTAHLGNSSHPRKKLRKTN